MGLLDALHRFRDKRELQKAIAEVRRDAEAVINGINLLVQATTVTRKDSYDKLGEAAGLVIKALEAVANSKPSDVTSVAITAADKICMALDATFKSVATGKSKGFFHPENPNHVLYGSREAFGKLKDDVPGYSQLNKAIGIINEVVLQPTPKPQILAWLGGNPNPDNKVGQIGTERSRPNFGSEESTLYLFSGGETEKEPGTEKINTAPMLGVECSLPSPESPSSSEGSRTPSPPQCR